MPVLVRLCLTWRTWVSFQSPFAVLIDGTLNLRAHVHKLGVVNRSRTCPAVYFTTEWPSPTLPHKLGDAWESRTPVFG